MNWFARFWQEQAEAYEGEPRLPKGIRIYAVGDIHGHDDLLKKLLKKIDKDDRKRGNARPILIFLGDLIDRGPDSAAVVERLLQLQQSSDSVIFLAGNHEEILLRILRGQDDIISDWLKFGGAECATSYGLKPKKLASMPSKAAGDLIRKSIPKKHRKFLEGFNDSFRAGDYLFVHAGVRPGVPFDEQAGSDLRWIREPFLNCEERHEAMVIHGHSITREIEETDARIGIDTGAYKYGVLTAVGLEGNDRWFIQVDGTEN